MLILVIFDTIQGLPYFMQMVEPGIQSYQDLPQTGLTAAEINNVPILVFFAVWVRGNQTYPLEYPVYLANLS